MFTDAHDYVFVKSIDNIIIDSNNDIKMKNAISFIDSKSKQKGVTIYQMIYELMQKDMIEEKAIQWLKTLNSKNDDNI
ncbi:MAG: hypothetical protein ABJB76_05220 [Candidatus Nitrosocosmicus sp.]